LRGNHEDDYLKFAKEEFRYFEWHLTKNNALNLLNGEKLAQKYYEFMTSLLYYYELDDFFLVHAGFDFSKEKPFENTDSMLWLRKTEPDLEFLKSRRIIVGHQPVYIEEIEKAINSRAQIIPLDNGVPCVKKHRIYDFTRLGSLCCLNLDTFELITQKNIDM